MPELSFVIPHSLDEDVVVARLKRESDVLRASFGDRVNDLEEVWENQRLRFRFTVFGMSVEGRITVDPTQMGITVAVPLAATMFKGVIEERVRSRLEELVTPQASSREVGN